MILQIMGHAPKEAVEQFCQEVRKLGLTVEDLSRGADIVCLRVSPIDRFTRGNVRELFWDLKQALEHGQYLHQMEVSDNPPRHEPELMTA
jgi:hypothetical protein